jgi:hypothetical protein
MKRQFPYAERAEAVEKARKAGHVGHFHALLELAYPPDFWEAYEALREGDASSIDVAIEFLEADPIFFRSGYVKADLLRWIKWLPLTPVQIERLRAVVYSVALRRGGREFRHYCNLAPRLEGPDLQHQLRVLQTHEDAAVRRRANWILKALGQVSLARKK